MALFLAKLAALVAMGADLALVATDAESLRACAESAVAPLRRGG